MNVKARAEAVGTFRHVNVFLMETLAAWVPTTPEMEVKILLGRHLWLVAQAADRLGKRARELRAPLHYSRPPAAAYGAALSGLAAQKSTPARLASLYGPALASLDRAYSDYLAATDAVIDEPTVLLIEDARRDLERMRGEQARLLQEFPALAARDAGAEAARLFANAGALVEAARESQPA